VSQVVGPELMLKSYSERKPIFLDLKYKGCFVDGTATEDLADGTVQK